jgi:S-DNA-T family DNA segregation ATPase FtsK/SpoIIIE
VSVRVFISYSHDSEHHRGEVLALCQQLREFGVDARLDQFDEVPPPPSWPKWMYEQIERAQFVLAICTPTYRNRVEGREPPQVGRGASWEGAILTQHLYEQAGSEPVKVLPVLLGDADKNAIPYFLRPTTFYRVDVADGASYWPLLEHLLDRPRVRPAPLGRPPADLASLKVQRKGTGDATASDVALPLSLLLVDLLGRESLNPEYLAARWADGRQDSAPVVLGAGHRGAVTWDPVTEGPHAVVAGTTGSGKSAFLQTLIASIALSYPPSQWNFLLVDYKGGAAFGPLPRLPHTLGIVTELDAHASARLRRALGAEIQRRITLLRQNGAMSINDLGHGEGTPELPRLMIVVDETATLSREVPDFIEGLVEVARVGRSLGIHVVWATQRPADVISDGIRAITAARFALRVADAADSVDVLGTDIAARLPRDPGMVYVSVHGSEPLLFRAAYMPIASTGEETDLEDAVNAAIDAAQRSGEFSCTNTTWVRGLPDTMPLETLWNPPTSLGRDVVGLKDLPDELVVTPWCLDGGRLGHLKVVGTARSGKSTALRTFAAIQALHEGPAGLEIVVIDGLNRGLRALGALPQTTYLLEPSANDVALILRLVAAEGVRRRQGLLTSPLPLNRKSALQQTAPRLLIVVDDAHLLVDASPACAEPLLNIVQQPPNTAIDLLIAMDHAGARRGLDHVQMPELLLRLSDSSDFVTRGLERGLPPTAPPGRGVLRPESVVVQVGHLGRDSSEDAQARAVRDIGHALTHPPRERPGEDT